MRKNTKILLSLFVSCIISNTLFADEGMWLVHLMEQTNYQAMKAKGLELTAEEIYSESKPSLKDAIVAIDHGSCTGSMISKTGLMITNHHCAYGDIQKLSTLENDYLRHGYWASNMNDEIHIPGKTVMFLDKVIDVTEEHAELVRQFEKDNPYPGFSSRRANSIIEKKYVRKGYIASCEVMFRGHKAYLYYYKIYEDVRLVAAPPTCFGAFGQDTDNWSWPQHKGDFAIYRIYGDKKGEPAKFSPDNKPIKPKHVIEVNIGGLEEGDYTMVLGYPGSTSRYLPSFGIKQKIDVTNPAMVKIRGAKLDILRKAMNNDEKINMQYASKYFNNSNGWKYAIGESEYTNRYNVVGKKQTIENQLTNWINSNPENIKKYGNPVAELQKAYNFSEPYMASQVYHREAILNGSDLLRATMRLRGVLSVLEKEKYDKLPESCEQYKTLESFATTFYKDYNEELDRKVLPAMLKLYVDNIHPDYLPQEIVALVEEYNHNYDALSNYIFDNSKLASGEKLLAWLKDGMDKNGIQNDPAFKLVKAAQDKNYEIRDLLKENGQKIGYYRTRYLHALLEMKKDSILAPDANSTMRVTYGTVGGYSPKDGVDYSFRSSIDGYKQKYIPHDPEFHLEPYCADIVFNENWGRCADKDGKLYTGFIADMDITGGNSGSPVLNSKGQLVGLAYDGNWESMAGDLYFNPEYNKCVSVDIRFVVWLIENLGDKTSILKEITIKTK